VGGGVSPKVMSKRIEQWSYQDRLRHFALWLTPNAYVASASPALIDCRLRLQPQQFLWHT
jgi:hypothetical protein